MRLTKEHVTLYRQLRQNSQLFDQFQGIALQVATQSYDVSVNQEKHSKQLFEHVRKFTTNVASLFNEVNNNVEVLFAIIWDEQAKNGQGDWSKQIPFMTKRSSKDHLLQYLWMQEILGIEGPTTIAFRYFTNPNIIVTLRRQLNCEGVSAEITEVAGIRHLIVSIGETETYRVLNSIKGNIQGTVDDLLEVLADTCSDAQETEQSGIDRVYDAKESVTLSIVQFKKRQLAEDLKAQLEEAIKKDFGNNEFQRQIDHLLDITKLPHTSFLPHITERLKKSLCSTLALTRFYLEGVCNGEEYEVNYFFNTPNIQKDSIVEKARDGGCLVLSCPIEGIIYKHYYLLATLLLSKFSSAQKIIHRIRAEKHAVTAGIAAIMGRNMSHNLGSHALGYLAEQEKFDGLQTRTFFRYVQKRMDFIAQISTAPPSWSLSLPLNWRQDEDMENTSSVLRKFCDNEYLLDNIVRADDLRFKEPGPKEYLLTLDVSLPLKNADNSKVVCNADIPHAQIGAHALYSILENIVRNAAKYRSQKKADLNLCIELHEGWPDHWGTENSRRSHKYWQDELLQVVIHHEGEIGRKAAAALNRYLAREIVNRATGELESGQWGMKEMKICAAYLRMIRQEDIDSHFLEYRTGDGIAPPIVEVVWGHPHQGGIVPLEKEDNAENDEESAERHSLHTTFYLLKPKDLLVIDGGRAEKINSDEALRKEFMRQGVEFWALQGQADALRERLEAGFRLRHQIMVLHIDMFQDEDWKWLNSNLNAMPCRLLLHGNEENVPEVYREKIKKVAEFIEEMPDEGSTTLGDNPEHWRLTIWNCWVQKRYGLRHSTGLPIYIRWVRGDHDDRNVESLDGIVRLVSQSKPDDSERAFGSEDDITDEELAGAIVFDHVGKVNQQNNSGYRVYDRSRFHESLDEGSPGRNIANGIIEDIGTDGNGTLKFPSRLMLRRLQEASVMTVGILDERLYESCQHESQKSMGAGKYVNIPLQEAWRRRGVYFLNHHKFLNEAPGGTFNSLDMRKRVGSLVQDKLLQVKDTQPYGMHHYYDCLIVHEGLIEKWLTTHSAKGQKAHWNDLRQALRSRARYLIITTGRGRPKTAEEHGWRWVEFSNLSDKVQHASKLQLVELLLAVKAVSSSGNGERKAHD